MHYPGDRIREYKVSTENLTEQQINQLDLDLQKPLRILFITAIVLFIIAFYLFINFIYYHIRVRLLIFTLNLPISGDDIRFADSLSWIIPVTLILLLIWKAYYLVAHYYISSKVKESQIKNLEAKVKELDKKFHYRKGGEY